MAYRGGDPWRFGLLGKTGVGKSAVGNTILGENVFKSESRATSVTSSCTSETREVDGKSITIVDTPGLYDTNMSHDFIVRETVKGIKMVVPGPHAFLLVIDVKRFTEEEKNTVRKFQEIFGEGVHKHMIVLFTRGDDLEHDNKTIDTFISEAGSDLRYLISSCGGRYHVFNNRRRENRTQVQELLQKVHDMLRLNNYKYYDYELFTMEREKKELEAKVRDLQRENNTWCLLL